MKSHDMTCYTVVETAAPDDTLNQARWYGGGGVNVYVDGTEVDFFTDYSIENSDDLVEAFSEYLAFQERMAGEPS